MDALADYLTPTDFSKRIGGIPKAFSMDEIAPYWLQFRENKLRKLLPETHAFWPWYANGQEDNAVFTNVDDELRPWAVYYIWAFYVLQGDAQQTKSGLVVKMTDSSQPLSTGQRTELHRRYMDLAAEHMYEVARLLTPATTCAGTLRRRSRRFRIVGKNKDKF